MDLTDEQWAVLEPVLGTNLAQWAVWVVMDCRDDKVKVG
jgi:hypothetical protein